MCEALTPEVINTFLYLGAFCFLMWLFFDKMLLAGEIYIGLFIILIGFGLFGYTFLYNWLEKNGFDYANRKKRYNDQRRLEEKKLRELENNEISK